MRAANIHTTDVCDGAGWRAMRLVSLRSANSLRAGAGHETADLRVSVVADIRPNYRPAVFVRFGYNGIVVYDNPISVESHSIVTVLCIPVDVVYFEPVGERAAESVS